MNYYVLIKKYKGSPLLGTIAHFEYTNQIGYYYGDCNCDFNGIRNNPITHKPSNYFKIRPQYWKHIGEIKNDDQI